MSVLPVCPKCSASLPMRDGKPAKFCTKCGRSVDLIVVEPEEVARPPLPHPKEQAVGEILPPLTVSPDFSNRPHSPSATVNRVTPPLVTSAMPADPFTDETVEIASWRWNWGAFLWPGVWALGNRIKSGREKTALAVLFLALPIAGFAIGAAVTVADALSHDQASFDKMSPNYTGVPNYLPWNLAVGPVTTLLVLYVIACLFSIRAARFKSYEAWSNFPKQNLNTFVRSQRIWAVSGFVLLSLLVGLTVYAWGKNNQASDAESDAYNRIRRLMPTYWAYQDASGRLIKYRFFQPYDNSPQNCTVGPENGTFELARFNVYGYRLNISSPSPTIGSQTFILSPDEQTLTEQNPSPGNAPRILRRTQQLAP